MARRTGLDPPAGKVIRIPRSPRRLLLTATHRLARGLAACPLAGANSFVGTEPAMADATRALPGNWHDEPSSPSPAQILSCNLGYTLGGSLLESRPGSILKSAEAQSFKSACNTRLDTVVAPEFPCAALSRRVGQSDIASLLVFRSFRSQER